MRYVGQALEISEPPKFAQTLAKAAPDLLWSPQTTTPRRSCALVDRRNVRMQYVEVQYAVDVHQYVAAALHLNIP